MAMNLARIALVAVVCFADCVVLLRAAPAMAAEIISDVAPPPPRTENIGHPRDGYVWAAGHWDWNGRAYQWVSGSWIVEHGKAHWIADRWEPTGARWRYIPGHWER
jgi:hypothetical protein